MYSEYAYYAYVCESWCMMYVCMYGKMCWRVDCVTVAAIIRHCWMIFEKRICITHQDVPIRIRTTQPLFDCADKAWQALEEWHIRIHKCKSIGLDQIWPKRIISIIRNLSLCIQFYCMHTCRSTYTHLSIYYPSMHTCTRLVHWSFNLSRWISTWHTYIHTYIHTYSNTYIQQSTVNFAEYWGSG